MARNESYTTSPWFGEGHRPTAGPRGHTFNAGPCKKCGKIHGAPKRNVPREIDLTPDFDLGWITGIVLGDCNITKENSGSYHTRLGSTDKGYVDLFSVVVKQRFPNLTVGRYDKMTTRRMPSGNLITSRVYWARIYSKRLFEFWRPHKLPDYYWTIPTLILSNIESKRGLLQGIFDAEGSIWSDEIQLGSKHKSNLEPIEPMLAALGMRSGWYTHRSSPHTTLRISGRNQCIQFRNKIGFRLPDKAAKLLPLTFKRRWKGREQLPWEMKTTW